MKRLYKCADQLEANILFDRLQTANVPCQVVNSFSSGALGEIPFTETGPEIWLEDEQDYARGRIIIDEYAAELKSGRHERDRYCSACGEANPDNFTTCWNCNKPLN